MGAKDRWSGMHPASRILGASLGMEMSLSLEVICAVQPSLLVCAPRHGNALPACLPDYAIGAASQRSVPRANCRRLDKQPVGHSRTGSAPSFDGGSCPLPSLLVPAPAISPTTA